MEIRDEKNFEHVNEDLRTAREELKSLVTTLFERLDQLEEVEDIIELDPDRNIIENFNCKRQMKCQKCNIQYSSWDEIDRHNNTHHENSVGDPRDFMAEIPTFSELHTQPGNPDDPFSTYNASKQSSEDPFASYNAKKSSEIVRGSSSERPNITISVPIRNREDDVPSKLRRVTRSSSRERDEIRIEVKHQRRRSREYDRYHHSDRSRDRRDDRYQSRSHRDNDRDHDRGRRRDHRHEDGKRHDEKRRYDDDRRYSDIRGSGHRDGRDYRRYDSDPRDDKTEKHRLDINEFRQVPAFRKLQEFSTDEVRQVPAFLKQHHGITDNPVKHFGEPNISNFRSQESDLQSRHDRSYPHREHWDSLPPPPPPPPITHQPYNIDPGYSQHRSHRAPHWPNQSVPADVAESRTRPPYLQTAPNLYQDSVLPPHIEHRLQPPEHRPEPYPHWDKGRPPPPEPTVHHREYPQRDRFGPIPGASHEHYHRPPPPQKLPDISDIAQIMKGLKENATKNLESTKELITTLMPPKPVTEAAPVDESKLPPRLGNSNYSSAAVSYKEPTPPPKSRPPVRKGPDYTKMFTKTANIYKSNWVKTPEKEEDSKASGSKDSEENERVIKLSGSLEVDLDDVNESQVNLLAKYLKFRTRGLRVVADNLPLRVKKPSENDDEDSALETVKSVRKAFNTRPNPIPGTMSCELCKKYNLPPDEYRRHINSDFHCWMDGSWKHKLPGYLPRFSMVWCTICRDFFMITFEGNTVLGHEDKDDHKKNKSVYRLQYDDIPNIKFCLLSDLRTTKVKMPTPLKCKYFTPREALESYKAAYSKLCDRNLVVD
ncbi:hypothetical protein ACHWQZ_G009873 [Mnemiopsis leidyi]